MDILDKRALAWAENAFLTIDFLSKCVFPAQARFIEGKEKYFSILSNAFLGLAEVKDLGKYFFPCLRVVFCDGATVDAFSFEKQVFFIVLANAAVTDLSFEPVKLMSKMYNKSDWLVEFEQ